MKHYGLRVAEGSQVTNLTVPSGTSFPENENKAELFYRSDQDKLYLYTGSWVDITGSASSLGSISDVDLSGSPAPTDGDVLTFDGSNWVHAAPTGGSGGLDNVVEDTSPQLGGPLDVNGQSIISTAGNEIDISAGNAITGIGGVVDINAGAGGGGNYAGGYISLTGGAGAGTQSGGAVTIYGGAGGATGTGGDVTIYGGAGGGTSGAGGNVTIGGADAVSSGAGGTITLYAGDGSGGTNAGGSVDIQAGGGYDGGDINITPGSSAGGSDGAIVIAQTSAPTVTTNKLYNLAGTLYWNGTDLTAGGGEGGEANTASNQGAGIGVFDEKTGIDLQFRSLVSVNNRLTISLDDVNDEIDFTINESNIDHDALDNFEANEHINHTSVTLTAGNGLTGGGTIAANRSFAVGAGTGISVAADSVAVDIDGLTADGSPNSATDYVATYDADAGTLKKVLLDDLSGGSPSFPLLATDGSTSDPSYSFASDSDTGIYRTGTDQLGLVAGGVELLTLIEDTTDYVQLGATLDCNGNWIGIDDADGIQDENGNEQIVFQTTASAVNYLEVTNAATGNGAQLAAEGETNVDLLLKAKGTGKVKITGLPFDITFQLDEGDDDTFTLHQYASFEYTVDKAYYKTDSGTITAAIKIDGTNITGLSALSLSSTEGNATASGLNTVNVGDTLTVVTSSDSSATNAVITLHCTRTGT